MQKNTSLCCIMKNCSDVITTFIEWATDNFDDINIVVDPNNDDSTYTLLKSIQGFYASPKINVQVHEFDDFSSQKQRAYDMCTKPYAVLIDSDEIIEELPDDGIEKVMFRAKADVGVFSRYNFQGDDEHCYGYPDNQYRVIRMESGVKMNGALVDESLDFVCFEVIQFPWSIIHYGHIRKESALKLKGRNRIVFAQVDACDGPMLKIYGEDWFIERNKRWNGMAVGVPSYITEQSRKYWLI